LLDNISSLQTAHDLKNL